MSKKEDIKNAIEEGYMRLMDESDNDSLFSEKVSKIVCSVREKFPNSDDEIIDVLEEMRLIDKNYTSDLFKAFEYLSDLDNTINAMSEDELKLFAAQSIISIYEARREKMVKDSIELMIMRFNKEEMKKFIEDKKYAEENNLFIFALSLPSNAVTALLCMEMEFKNDPTYIMKHKNDKYIVVNPQDYYKWRNEHGKVKK